MSVATAIISSVFQGIGAELSAAGDIQEGKAIRQAEEINAQLAEQDADLQEQVARARAGETREEARRTRAAQRARFAKAGIDPDQGSPLLLQAETLEQGEKAALQEEFFGSAGASRFRTEAAQRRAAGAFAEKRGRFKAGQTLLTGISGSVGSGLGAAGGGTSGFSGFAG
jgi:hypothetical protein